jgi:hypothetical protein
MFSPHDNPAVNNWFQRLDAAWRRMPAEERAKQGEEVQQHLEALVAMKVAQGQSSEDAWNTALVQFGDPDQIGRKVYHEWRQSKTGFRADMTAILFGIGLHVVGEIGLNLLTLWALLWPSVHPVGTTVVRNLGTNPVINYMLIASIYTAIGLRYPCQAIKGALYSFLLSASWGLISLALFFSAHPTLKFPQPFSAMLAHNLLWMPLWAAGEVGVAYLASITKRGWYRPSWADFKITLPKRRRQVG